MDDFERRIAKHGFTVPGKGDFAWNAVRSDDGSSGIEVRFRPAGAARPLRGWMEFRLRFDDALDPVWDVVRDSSAFNDPHVFAADLLDLGRRIAEALPRIDPAGFAAQVRGAVAPEIRRFEEDVGRMGRNAHWLANRAMVETDADRREAVMDRLALTRTRLSRLEREFGGRIEALRSILEATEEWCKAVPEDRADAAEMLAEASGRRPAFGPA